MSRKHGFRGTPVRPSDRPGTMGRVFETRGDPLVSPKEGREKFGRNLDTENPDYDRMFAPIARDLLKPQQVDRTRQLGKLTAKQDTLESRTSQILQAMWRKEASIKKKANRVAVIGRAVRREQDGVLPDNVPRTVIGHSDAPSREKQTPKDAPSKSTYDFTGKSPPKEIKKCGKIYRRK